MTDELREWLDKAEWDWRSAGDLFGLPTLNTGLVLFLYQQCVEKWLKAALIFRGETPPKIHDLVSLSNRLSKLAASWQWDVSELRRRTKGAVDYQYPGTLPSVDAAKTAYELAGRLRVVLLPLVSPPPRDKS